MFPRNSPEGKSLQLCFASGAFSFVKKDVVNLFYLIQSRSTRKTDKNRGDPVKEHP